MKKLCCLFFVSTLFLNASNSNVMDSNTVLIEKDCNMMAFEFLEEFEDTAGGCLSAEDYNSMMAQLVQFCEIMM